MDHLIKILVEGGAVVAALAVSLVCLVGLVVWLSGSNRRIHKPAK